MKFAGIVVLYKPREEIKEKINTYMPHLEILYVVDNSPNQQNESLLPKSKKIKYICNNENLGIAKALNIGCEHAIQEGFDWILTMDQDSAFTKDNLEKLMDYVEKEATDNIGIVSPYHLIVTNVPRSKLKVEHPVEVMTSGNLLNLKLYQKIGGFKDWLFIDCVDIEYCMNLRVNGFDIIRLNEVVMNHNLGDSKTYRVLWKKVVTSNHNALRRYYITRNCYYIYDMYHEYFPEYCNYVRGGIKYQVRNIFFLERHKFKKIRNIYRGIKDYKKGVTGAYPYTD